MCDVCPSDGVVLSYLIGVSVFLSLIIFAVSKNKLLPLLIFSVLVNGIFLFAILLRSLFFRIYGVEWLQYFSVFLWPLINIIFIIWYVRNKKH